MPCEQWQDDTIAKICILVQFVLLAWLLKREWGRFPLLELGGKSQIGSFQTNSQFPNNGKKNSLPMVICIYSEATLKIHCWMTLNSVLNKAALNKFSLRQGCVEPASPSSLWLFWSWLAGAVTVLVGSRATNRQLMTNENHLAHCWQHQEVKFQLQVATLSSICRTNQN